MSKAYTPSLYNKSENNGEIEMTKRGRIIHSHLEYLEEELLLKFSHGV